MARYVLLEEDPETGEEFEAEDVTTDVAELLDEHEEMRSRLEQVALAFDEPEESASPKGLSLARQPAKKAAGGSAGRVGNAKQNFANNARITPKKSAAAAFGSGQKAKGASIGKHLKHAAKVVGRAAAKHPFAAGVATGVVGSGAIMNMSKGRNPLAKNPHHALSQDDLQLEGEEIELLDAEQEFEDVEYTQEQLDAMTPEEAQELLDSAIETGEVDEDELEELEADAAEEQRRQELQDFAKSRKVLVEDAESRTPVKK